jgi:prevent-host-death family protein
MGKVSETRSLYEAKTGLSGLVERAARGAEVVITKHGKPMAKLVPYKPNKKKPKRKPGGWEGKVWITDDFNDPLPADILYAFNEKPIEPSST